MNIVDGFQKEFLVFYPFLFHSAFTLLHVLCKERSLSALPFFSLLQYLSLNAYLPDQDEEILGFLLVLLFIIISAFSNLCVPDLKINCSVIYFQLWFPDLEYSFSVSLSQMQQVLTIESRMRTRFQAFPCAGCSYTTYSKTLHSFFRHTILEIHSTFPAPFLYEVHLETVRG